MLSNVCACHCITAAWASPSLPCHLPSFCTPLHLVCQTLRAICLALAGVELCILPEVGPYGLIPALTPRRSCPVSMSLEWLLTTMHGYTDLHGLVKSFSQHLVYTDVEGL